MSAIEAASGGQRSGARGCGPPLGALTRPPTSTPRNFRKHLRMVGSRRVKAQSKTQELRGRWAGKAALGLRGFACYSWPPPKPPKTLATPALPALGLSPTPTPPASPHWFLSTAGGCSPLPPAPTP